MRRPCNLGRMWETSCPPKRTPDRSDSLPRPPGTCCRTIALDLMGRWLDAELKAVCRSGGINCYMRELVLAQIYAMNAKISLTACYHQYQHGAEYRGMFCWATRLRRCPCCHRGRFFPLTWLPNHRPAFVQDGDFHMEIRESPSTHLFRRTETSELSIKRYPFAECPKYPSLARAPESVTL
jgi:hypothetical protein